MISLGLIATIGCLLGNYWGSKGKSFYMNLIWSFADLIWIYLAIVENSSTLYLFIACEILAIYGVINLWPWSKKNGICNKEL